MLTDFSRPSNGTKTGPDPRFIARAYCATHGLGAAHEEKIAAALVSFPAVIPLNGWFSCYADTGPSAFETAKAAKEARACLKRFMVVKFRKVMYGPKPKYHWTGDKGAVNGSPMFFCGECTRIWVSHTTTPSTKTGVDFWRDETGHRVKSLRAHPGEAPGC